jgi:hypothetical protein
MKGAGRKKSAYSSLIDTKRKPMNQNRDMAERRQHERAKVQSPVIGILNADEPLIIGSINNISLGGVKFIHALTLPPINNPIRSIDLITDNFCLTDIPCNYAWDDEVAAEPDLQLRELKLCGIEFGDLTANQFFLLEGFIDRFTSLKSIRFGALDAYSQ